MFYTITITNNQSSQPVKVSNYEDISISPTLEYSIHDYISDNYTTQAGYISIPLYNDVRYINIPRNTVITLYTENSDEALYYNNLNIPNCEVSIDEKDTEKFTPQNTIVFKQNQIPNLGVASWQYYVNTNARNYVKYIAVPDGATYIANGAFQSCPAEYIYIPKTVTSIGISFNDCSNITAFEIQDSVKTVEGGAFVNCKSLKSVKIGKGLTELREGMFDHCTSLEDIEIPNNIVKIYPNVFQYCSSLKSITIPSSVTSIGIYTFLECSSLETIYINKPEGSISGAPWSAPETTQIIWNG